MRLKICTVRGCITCNSDMNAQQFVEWLGGQEDEGAKWFCCGPWKCVRISQITSVTAVRTIPQDGEDEDEDDRSKEPEEPRTY